MSYRAAPVPVELDGQTSENVVGAPPPTYVGRALSYTEGGEAREAVQKPEDKSPSATRTP